MQVGTVAINGAPDDAGLFFVGVRLMAAGDSSGVVFTGDLDFGARPRLFESGSTAVAVVLAGGIGGGVIAATTATIGIFHLAARLGLSLDVDMFTFEFLPGAALYANKGAFGAFEGIMEVGVRF